MGMTKDELRAKLSAVEKRNGRTRYERSLVDAVVEHAGPRKAAGESLSQVAEDLGMSAGNLQRWFGNFTRRGERAQGSKAPTRRPAAGDSLSPMAFVRLEPSASRVGEPLEILLAGGVAVRVPVGFDGATLSRVLTLVKGGVA
jgi:transposase-like protein